jgi:hypothetical protein
MRCVVKIWLFVLLVGFQAVCRADTSYALMTARLHQLCQHSKYIKMYDVGKSASGNRSVWLVVVADPSVDQSKCQRIMVLCRQHGDEPVSTDAALSYLDKVSAGMIPYLHKDLQRSALYLFPMVNPDGADSLTRENARGVDLNRDWGNFKAPETRAVYHAYKMILPDFVLDMHTWDSDDPFKSTCLEAPKSASPLAHIMRSLQERAAEEVSEIDGDVVATTSYDSNADSSLCHRYFAMRKHVPSLLFETSPPGDGADQSQKRVQLACELIEWTMRDSATHKAAWSKIVMLASDARTKDGSAKSAVMGWTGVYRRPSAPLPAPRSYKPILWMTGCCALIILLVMRLKPSQAETGLLLIKRVKLAGGGWTSRLVYMEQAESETLFKRHARRSLRSSYLFSRYDDLSKKSNSQRRGEK